VDIRQSEKDYRQHVTYMMLVSVANSKDDSIVEYPSAGIKQQEQAAETSSFCQNPNCEL